MSEVPSLHADSRPSRSMRDNGLGVTVALGVIVGLVWGLTTGVGFSVLVGYGLLGTWAAFVPGGMLVGSVVGLAVHRRTRPLRDGRDVSDRAPS